MLVIHIQAYQIGMKIAAKSGTAQENTKEPDHSLLVTYSPYDNPEICVSVCIQHGYSYIY